MAHYITSGLAIDESTVELHGENGEGGDRRVCLRSALEADGIGTDRWYYLTTNGDDVLVGWGSVLGDAELNGEIADWINAEDSEWLRELLPSLGFDLSGVLETPA